MKIQLKQAAMTFVLSASLLMSGLPAWADGYDAASDATSAAVYHINESLHVKAEGIYNEKTSAGVRLGAVIRIANTSGQTLRVPDHELRVTTSEGTVYTLRPSSSNARGIQPNSEVELTYYKLINRQTEISLKDLSLIDVNYNVFPKLETTLLTIPVSGTVWNGSRSEFENAAASKAWGEPFAIPMLQSPLTYTTVEWNKSNTASGVDYVVKLLVENPSDQTETIPALLLDGKSKGDFYTGKRLEGEDISLEPGEKTYIHFVIHAKMDTVLESFNVLTPESFTQTDAAGQAKTVNFSIGRLNVKLQNRGTTADNYTYGTPIAFEPWNNVIHQDLNVALTELHVTDNKDQGSKVAFAKFSISNKGQNPVPMPAFQTELSSLGGHDYTGVRQTAAQTSVAPGTSIVVSYAFVLPVSEENEAFTMNIQEVVASDSANGGNNGYKSTIASYKAAVQGDDDRHSIKLYPYTLNIKDYFLSQMTVGGSPYVSPYYTYKLRLNLDIARDRQVITDGGFSKLKFELADGNGGILGSKSFPFMGADRLVNGDQTLTFTNLSFNQIQSGVSVKVYETMSTPAGEIDRFIAELK